MESSWKKNYTRYRTILLQSLDQYQRKADVKIYIEIILSLLTVTIFSIFALKPTLITIAQLIKDVDTKKNILVQMEAKIDQLNNAQTVFDREKESIDLLTVAIPYQPQPNIYIRQVEGVSNKTAKVTNMTIDETVVLGNSIQQQKSDEKSVTLPDGVISSKVSLSAQSQLDDYVSSYNFIKEIENLRIPFNIESLSINVNQDEEGGDTLTVFMNGIITSLKKGN